MKTIVIDLDDTISRTSNGDYKNAEPIMAVIDLLRKYQSDGFKIAISTSRNMRTFRGNVGKINAVTLPLIIEWLELHNVPYDEVFVGKPWCGEGGFYVDDKAIRPNEFLQHSYKEILNIIKQE